MRRSCLLSRRLAACLFYLPVYLLLAQKPGDLDMTFDARLNGPVETGGEPIVHCVVSLGDGKMLVGGLFRIGEESISRSLVRLNGDGTLDPASKAWPPILDQSGRPAEVFSIAVQANGVMVVGGAFDRVGEAGQGKLARLNPNGTLDTAFAPKLAGDNELFGMGYGVSSVAVQPDNKILVAGYFTMVDDVPCEGFVRLHSDGTLDSSFNPPSLKSGPILLQPDGKIVIPGYRLHPDGRVDAILHGDSGYDYEGIFSLSLLTNGGILAGGYFKTINGIPRNNIARLSGDGAVDKDFNPGAGPNYVVDSVLQQKDGKVIIGGRFSKVNDLPRTLLARLNVDGSLDALSVEIKGASFDWNATVRVLVPQDNDRILIGGQFATVQGVQRKCLARIYAFSSEEPPVLPLIKTQPGNLVVSLGEEDAVFRVEAESSSVLAYQWQFNEHDIPGATNSSLTLTNIRASQAGIYRVLVKNNAGTVISDGASLTVQDDTRRDLDQWSLRHRGLEDPMTRHKTNLSCYAYGNGLHVMVGRGGRILTSLDGNHWVEQTSGVSDNLTEVVYGNSRFVAAATNSVIIVSENGMTWTKAFAGIVGPTKGLIYGDGLFIIRGDAMKRVYSSPDGVAWTPRLSIPEGVSLERMAYGTGRLVAVGFSGTLSVSTNLSEWIFTTPPVSIPYFSDVVFGGGQFVATGFRGAVITSADGLNWSAADSGTQLDLQSIAYGGGQFAVSAGAAVLWSADGKTWNRQSETGATLISRLFAGDQGYFAFVSNWVPGAGMVPDILMTRDGALWQSVGSPNHLRAVAFGAGVFVGVGDNGIILASTNGLDWVIPASPTVARLNDIQYAQGRFVAAGNRGTLVSSTNGFDWQAQALGTTLDLTGITFGQGQFVVVGGHSQSAGPTTPITSGIIVTSPEGLDWTIHWAKDYSGFPQAVAYGDSLFVSTGIFQAHTMEGWENAALLSTNGQDWMRSRAFWGQPGTDIDRVIFGNGLFLVHLIDGSINQVLRYRPGVTNDYPAAYLSDPGLSGLAYDDGIFVALGEGVVYSSTHEKAWKRHETGIAAKLMDTAFGLGTFVAVGENETILQSAHAMTATRLFLTLTGFIGPSVELSFQSEEGKHYTLEFADALNAGWKDLQSTNGNGSSIRFVDPGPLQPERFYRLREAW